MKNIKIALAGQPNSGKTTIFNAITGANQKTGNYPGVTVEKIQGYFSTKTAKYEVIDLPGIYSLSTNSPEEIIARDVLISEQPDLVVNIVDASNLERNLYLTTQLLEMKIPMIMVFNMADVIKRKGTVIKIKELEKAFGCKIVLAVGHKKIGLDDVVKAIEENVGKVNNSELHYSFEAEEKIKEIINIVEEEKLSETTVPDRWLAIKVMERDEYVNKFFKNPEKLYKKLDDTLAHFKKQVDEDLDVYFAYQRYGFISGVCTNNVNKNIDIRHSISDKIDAVLTNRFLGLPIFFILMYVVFKLTFWVGDPLMSLIEVSFEHLSGFISGFWVEGSESLLRSLIVDGIIGGVGGVVIFLPNIILLFLAISILEGTGYMSRAAFIMDRLMRSIGLHGNSFIPMLIGFGCTVPAIMATRTLSNKKDRFTTIMVAPLMSCGARLPIYALIIPAFFAENKQAMVLWIVYFVGILLAIVIAKILRSTIFKGERESFIMELPPYRIPTLRSVIMQMWSRAIIYLKKAGTIILGISILMWVLITFPQGKKIEEKYDNIITNFKEHKLTQEEQMFVSNLLSDISEDNSNLKEEIGNDNLSEDQENEVVEILNHNKESDVLANSITGRLGKVMQPLLAPLGFDWKIGSAMIGAFAAKEVFVAQLGIVYSVGEADEESETLREKLKDNYSALQAIAIMLFSLISAPCMATIAITKRETNSWKWAFAQLIGLTAVAYIVTLLVYQVGILFGF